MYFLRPGAKTYPGAFSGGGASGENVVDEQNPLSRQTHIRTKPVDTQHVCPPGFPALQAGLGAIIPNFSQYRNRLHGKLPSHGDCQKPRLVIAPAEPSQAAHRYPGQHIEALRVFPLQHHGKKAARVCYGVIALVFIAVGATQKVSLVWDMSDMFNGLMVIPNLLAVLALSNIVAKFAKDDHTLTGE